MVIIVLKTVDFRASLQEITAVMAIRKILDNFNPKNVFVIFTHCDLQTPDEELIQGKLSSFKKHGGVEIPRNNVILFANSKESLIPFVDQFVNGDMHITIDLEEKLAELVVELP